jgi:hypothetical protein
LLSLSFLSAPPQLRVFVVQIAALRAEKEGGQLTEKVRRKPFSVVLFD